MKAAVIGGGPAGLFSAILMKRANPATRVTVFERNRADDTYGFGVVFSDQTLENVREADPETFERVSARLAHWDDIDIHFKGRTITSGGHGFSGIARRELLAVLQERALELDVDLRFSTEIRDLSQLAAHGIGDSDVIIAADGINSATRRARSQQFGPSLEMGSARYIWLGTTLPLDAFTFIVVHTAEGVFQAHAYRFAPGQSTFIVECDEASWRSAGFDRADAAETIRICEAMFEPWLDGHRLVTNAPHLPDGGWTRFMRVRNRTWHDGNVALIGDAAHTAHFSIGSGTKLALEDAIALSRALEAGPPLERGLERYQEERMIEALKLQNAARNSMEWFENVRRYVHFEPEQFAYSLLTRSQRVSHENLRLRDGAYLSGVERWYAASTGVDGAVPPMFTPFTLRGMTLDNRVVVSPMDMYSATDGVPDDFHLVHLGARAQGGAALVITEMTCVSAEGRITPGCTGMYDERHVGAWRRIVDFVHHHSRAKICLQLGHSGRKGSTKLMWEGMDVPLDEGNWEVIGPSPLPYGPNTHVPREMTRADMDLVRQQFVRATRMALDAGFDMVELHCAHGYLLSSFITPLSNVRRDEFGGSLVNRLRYPIEVLMAMRAEWPQDRPMSVRISATDWMDGGVDSAEAVEIAKAFVAAGADIIHVSTGQTAAQSKPVYGRMFQTPYSDRIRNEGGVKTIAVGNITEADQVNGIIAAGRADLCALGRPHLADPYWTLHAAAELGFAGQHWPVQYRTGRTQLERSLQRMREATAKESPR